MVGGWWLLVVSWWLGVKIFYLSLFPSFPLSLFPCSLLTAPQPLRSWYMWLQISNHKLRIFLENLTNLDMISGLGD